MLYHHFIMMHLTVIESIKKKAGKEIFTVGWCGITVGPNYSPLFGFVKDIHVLPLRLGDHHGGEWGHKAVLQGQLQSIVLHFLFLRSRYQQPALWQLQCDNWDKQQQNIGHFYTLNVCAFHTTLWTLSFRCYITVWKLLLKCKTLEFINPLLVSRWLLTLDQCLQQT